MTDLKSPVSRRTIAEHPVQKRRVVATLNVGDTLTLRLERSQKEYHLPLMSLFDQAELKHAQALAGFDAGPCSNPKRARNL